MSAQDGPPIWSHTFSMAKQVLKEVKDGSPKEPFEMPTALVFVLGMFWRAVRLYEATLRLLESHLPEEGAILARSLFEESLRLRQLADDKENRGSPILGWANHSISEQVGLIRDAESLGLEPNAQLILTVLEQNRTKLRSYARRNGISKLVTFLSVKDAAKRYGRKDDYWTYAWSHESVHGSDSAWSFSRRRLAPSVVGLFAKNADPQFLIGFAAFAAVSLADAAEAAASLI